MSRRAHWAAKSTFLGSAKTDPVRFKRNFEEGLLKDNLSFLRLIEVLFLRGEKQLAKRPFLQAKPALLKMVFKLDRVSFPLPIFSYFDPRAPNLLSPYFNCFGNGAL